MYIYTCAVSKRKPAVHVQDVPAPEGRKTPLAFLAQVTAEPGPNIQPRVSPAVLPFVQRTWTCPGACSCGFLCERPGLMLVTGCGRVVFLQQEN